MIIYLAGLQGVPDAYYEAASIDGANWWQRLWYITIPLLSPVTFFITVVSLIRRLSGFSAVLHDDAWRTSSLYECDQYTFTRTRSCGSRWDMHPRWHGCCFCGVWPHITTVETAEQVGAV